LRRGLSSVTADKSQLEQVILNLAINARDAMPEPGCLKIETDEELLSEAAAAELGAPVGRYVTLTVTDTGYGMSEETRKRVFEPFFTTKELGKGTGLGLSTVYGIIRQSGGYIRVVSALGEGTQFRILLPPSVRHDRLLSSLPPRTNEPAGARVLLVERDDSVRQIASRILRSEGYWVSEASGLDEARRALSSGTSPSDVLLIDIGTANPAFQQEIATALPNLRLVLMTGGGPAAERQEASPLVEAALLAKPFSRMQLLETVRAVLQASVLEEGS
jgi:CheY-like chemotaxis protein